MGRLGSGLKEGHLAPPDQSQESHSDSKLSLGQIMFGGGGNEGGRGATTGCATEADAPPSRQHAPASKDPHVCSQKGCLNGAPNRNWTPHPQAPAARE